MRASRRPAVIRGFSASSLAIFVALAGHVSAGGAMPGPLGILVPWMLASMVCVLLAGRTLSLLRLGLSVAASQFLFHTLFVLGTITPTAAPRGHMHGTMLMLPSTGAIAETVSSDGMMWFGHAIAAAVTILALHRGERLLLALRDLAAQALRWLRGRLDTALVLPAVRRDARAAVFSGVAHLQSARLLSSLRGRAPPLLPAV